MEKRKKTVERQSNKKRYIYASQRTREQEFVEKIKRKTMEKPQIDEEEKRELFFFLIFFQVKSTITRFRKLEYFQEIFRIFS